MADMSVPSLLERSGTHIFGRSMRRRTASSSRGPVFPDTGFEPNLLPWFRSKRQTAFPPPSSGCHHFHKAPSSDGAPFFCCHAFGHGSPANCAFVGLAAAPHKRWRVRHPSSSAASHGQRPRPAAPKAPLIPSSGAFLRASGDPRAKFLDSRHGVLEFTV